MPTGDVNASGTVSSSALALTDAPFSFTAAQIAAAKAIMVTVTGDNVRWMETGDAPTATDGHILVAPGTYPFDREDGVNIGDIQFIRETTDATVLVQLMPHGFRGNR